MLEDKKRLKYKEFRATKTVALKLDQTTTTIKVRMLETKNDDLQRVFPIL